MPIPLLLAGAALQGLNMGIQSGNNKAQRKWNEKMYGVQRADALADWNMQNEYNSPSAQMKRFREANLNPALMYGNGANQPTAQIRNSQVESWNPQSPHADLGQVVDSLMAFTDIKMKEAQTNNLEAQNNVILEDQRLRQAQTIQTLMQSGLTQVQAEKVMQDIKTGTFDLSQKERLADTNFETKQAELRKLQVDTQFTLNEDQRKAAMNSTTIAEAKERILTMQAEREFNPYKKAKLFEEIKAIQRDNKLKTLDIKLKENGIMPHDPLWQRLLKKELDNVATGKSATINNVKEAIKKIKLPNLPKDSSYKTYPRGKFSPYN